MWVSIIENVTKNEVDDATGRAESILVDSYAAWRDCTIILNIIIM